MSPRYGIPHGPGAEGENPERGGIAKGANEHDENEEEEDDEGEEESDGKERG